MYTILYYTILYYTTLYYTILYYTTMMQCCVYSFYSGDAANSVASAGAAADVRTRRGEVTIIRNPKSYPHPRLQDFPRWKKT